MSDFNINGGYFAPQGYISVDAGGSHEENPNGGVQIGTDSEGVPNLLEEGEKVYDDFVYSDNIYADGGLLKKHNLPDKYSGKLYSDIANELVDAADPGDYISNNGMKKFLYRLAEAQEEQKDIRDKQELEDELSQLSPEEQEQLMAMLGQQGQPIDMEVPQEQIAPEQIAPEGIVPEEVPVEEGQQFAQGGPKEDYWWVEEPSVEVYDKAAGTFIQKPVGEVTGYANASSSSEPTTATTGATQIADGYRPTWLRYAGIGLDAAMLAHNLMEEPTRYTVPNIDPVLPYGHMRTVNQRYQAVDPNMVAESVLSQGNATQRAILNSGSGPSTMAGLVAADYNLTNALGNAWNQSWHNANEGSNNVIAANNETEARRAAFDFGVSQARASAINRAEELRAQYYMLKQQLDSAEDAQQAQAISSQMNAIAKAISDIGNENFASNMVRDNKGVYWYVGNNGRLPYKYPKGFFEDYTGE